MNTRIITKIQHFCNRIVALNHTAQLTVYKEWHSFNDAPLLKNLFRKLKRDLVKKKSLTLSQEELQKFIETAPNDESKYLVRKVIAIIDTLIW